MSAYQIEWRICIDLFSLENKESAVKDIYFCQKLEIRSILGGKCHESLKVDKLVVKGILKIS